MILYFQFRSCSFNNIMKTIFKVFNKFDLFHAEKFYEAVKDLLENDR